jgi:hypothetical protein
MKGMQIQFDALDRIKESVAIDVRCSILEWEQAKKVIDNLIEREQERRKIGAKKLLVSNPITRS